MEFIVEHQAKFSVDIDRHSGMLAKHNEAIGGLIQVSRTLVERQLAAEAQMTELRSEMKQMARAQKELFQVQKATEKRLDAFVGLVGRYLSGRDGGRRRKN